MRAAWLLVVALLVPRPVDARPVIDCAPTCADLLCSSNGFQGPLIEGTVVAQLGDSKYRIAIAAVHGTPRQGLDVGDEVDLYSQLGSLTFAAGARVLAVAVNNENEVRAVAPIGGDDHVSCSEITYGFESFTIDRADLVAAIVADECRAEVVARGYEPKYCDTSEGCAAGGGPRGGATGVLILAALAVYRSRRRRSVHTVR